MSTCLTKWQPHNSHTISWCSACRPVIEKNLSNEVSTELVVGNCDIFHNNHGMKHGFSPKHCSKLLAKVTVNLNGVVTKIKLTNSARKKLLSCMQESKSDNG
jgi:hypothetical protein